MPLNMAETEANFHKNRLLSCSQTGKDDQRRSVRQAGFFRLARNRLLK